MPSDDATARLRLPFLAAAQSQKHVTVNEALGRLDVLVQAAARSRTTTAEPASPTDGDVYVLPAAATGADWAGQPAGRLAGFADGVWSFTEPATGWLVHVADEGGFIVRQGGAWRVLGEALLELQHVARLGVNGTADDANRLVVRGPAALMAAADGGPGDFRLTLDKLSSADTASVVFQTGWSGRAELGAVGDDDLHLRVSADGASWRDGLVVSATAEEVRLCDGALTIGRQGAVSYIAKPPSSVLVLGPAGGVGADGFWRGVQVSSPGFTVAGAGAYPRFSTYFSFDTATSPSHVAVRQEIGNVPAGLDVDLVLAPGGAGGSVVCERPLRVPAAHVAALPSASAHGAGAIVYVTDASGGATLAVSDGSAWRRTSDGAAVS